MAHNLNLTVQNALKLWNKHIRLNYFKLKYPTNSNRFYFRDDECNEIVDENSIYEVNSEDEDEHDDDSLSDGYDEYEDENESYDYEEFDNESDGDDGENVLDCASDAERTAFLLNSSRKVLHNIRVLVSKINRSNPLALYVMKKKHESLIDENFYHDFKVRWNTTYVMIDRSLKLKSIINEVTNNSSRIPNLSVSYCSILIV